MPETAVSSSWVLRVCVCVCMFEREQESVRGWLDPFGERLLCHWKKGNLYECHEKSFKSLRGSIRKVIMYQEKKGISPPRPLWFAEGSNPCITFSRARLKLGFEIINWPVAWSEELAFRDKYTNQKQLSGKLYSVPCLPQWFAHNMPSNMSLSNGWREDFILKGCL